MAARIRSPGASGSPGRADGQTSTSSGPGGGPSQPDAPGCSRPPRHRQRPPGTARHTRVRAVAVTASWFICGVGRACGAGLEVRTDATLDADGTSVTLPAEVLAQMEGTLTTIGAAEADMRDVELREQLAAAWANARAIAVAEGRANQARLYRLWQLRFDPWYGQAGFSSGVCRRRPPDR